ncbi:MAG: hypothetical protein IT389_09600 [Nitrospira sp.]|nr:hypothetical protein [Nitrospira sp.]
MKYRWIMKLLAVSIGMMSVCAEAGEQPVTPGAIAKEARETVEATVQYTAQEKEAFQRKAQEKLTEMQKRMAALQARADKASASARAELQQSIHELEVKKEAARKQLDGLASATDEKWNEMKTGAHAAMEELNQSYQRLRSQFQ